MAKNNAINNDISTCSGLPPAGVSIGANSAMIVSNSSGAAEATATMTDGQVIVGSTGATPTATTLTAGTGITVTNGAGIITIAATGGGGANGLLNVQRLTTTGTYTATAGTVSCVVMAVAGGGGGGAVVVSASDGYSASGSGGGGGAFGQKYYAVAPTGTAYVIGAGGAGGAAGANFGAAGSATTFNAGDMNLLGGGGGYYMNGRINSAPTAYTSADAGGSPDASDNSDITSNGDSGALGRSTIKAITFTVFRGPGFGGSSMLGKGALAPTYSYNDAAGSPGNNAVGYGGGGSGAFYATTTVSASAAAGGNGAPGIIIVYEYGA